MPSLIQTREGKQGKLGLEQAGAVPLVGTDSWYDVFGIWDLEL